MPERLEEVTTRADFDEWLAPAEAKTWCVDVQGAPRGYEGPRAVLGYLAGYVVGTAIHDGRIKRYDGRCVVIKVKSYRTDTLEELPMTGEEFVRRYAMHILPDRFVRIRYAGMFAARYRKDWLAKCRELLGTDEDEPEPDEHDEEKRLKEEECAEARPAPECRRCATPDMVSTGNRTAWETNNYLAYLCALFDRMFTWLSTFDLDPAPFPQSHESYDCAAHAVVITCVTTADGCDLAITNATLPRPDT